MKPNHEAHLLTSIEQAHQQLVLARLESERERGASARTTKICVALQEQLLELEAALRQTEQRRAAESEEAVDRLTRRHAEFTASLAEGARARDTLARQLNLARETLEQVRHAREADGIAAAEALRRHQTEFEDALAAAAGARAAAERQIESLRADIQQAEARHAEELTAAASERHALQNQLEEAEAQRVADAVASAQHLEERQAAFEGALATAAAARGAAEQQIEILRADIQQAEARHASERASDADRLAAHDAAAAASVAQLSDQCDALARQLMASSVALEASQQQRALEAADAQAALEQTVAEAAATRATFERQLSDAAVALERAEEHRAADAVASAQHFEQRQAEFEAALAAAAAARGAVEQQLESLRVDIQQAEARRASEAAADAERRAAHDATVAANLAQISEQRDALARQLNASLAALDESQKQLALEATAVERLTLREAELLGQLAQEADRRATLELGKEQAARAQREAEWRHSLELSAAASERHALQRQFEEAVAQAATAREEFDRRLSDSAAALEFAEQLAETERMSASAREQSIQGALSSELQRRASVEHDLSEARAEFSHSRRRLLMAASALRRRTAERRTQRETQFAEERTDHERRLGAREDAIRQVEAERDTLRQSLDSARAELQALSDNYDNARIEFERAQSSNEAKLQGLAGEYDMARHSLDHLRDAFNTLENVSSEHAIERARLEGVVIERDARISAQEAARLSADQAGKEALRQAEDLLRQTVERKNNQIGGLERELESFRHDLERARLDGEAENRRQFEQAPHAMCRLTRGGALLATNQAFARVLGYRSTDDLGKPDLATAVFEAPADLHWLIEHAAGGAEPATIETVWKKKDRARLSVRLQVVRTKEDWLEVGAEDITLLRTTEENLRQARRMEAVGRLASEVAVTCDTLLRGVSHSGQYWLAAIGSDLGLRRQGEQILGDVAHATSLLQRLAAYSNEQTDALQPVNLQRVLRNLEPVLKRVAGDDIEVVLPKHIRPFSVDVERTRVERVLVNVASYARERMPHGGRLKIDLDSAVVDRAFLDKYPNVRPGPHVIATVTEERRTTLTGLPVPSADDSRTSAGEKPGVDLSALLQLLGDCGGHLWVTAEPPGNMTLKIHLPLRASDAATSPAGWLARAGGGRALGRWSRH